MFKKYLIIGFLLFLASCKVQENLNISGNNSCQNNNKFDCIIDLVIKEGNQIYCENLLSEKSEKQFCYLIAAFKNRNYQLCDKVGSETEISQCKFSISVDSGDLGKCKQYASEEQLPIPGPVAITPQMICEGSIKKQLVRLDDGTVLDFRGVQDEEQCKEYKTNSNLNESVKEELKERCYYDLAVNSKNIYFCEYTTSLLKYVCEARTLK